MASFLSKQRIIQLMCVIHIFPFADPGRGVEIKDSFLFYRAVELKPDADLLPGFSEGLLAGLKPVEGAFHFTGTKWLLHISSTFLNMEVPLMCTGGTALQDGA